MNLLRFLFQHLPVVLSFVAAVTLHAGASNKNGNPFGNGTFFDTTGTFSAVIRGQNLSGTMIFSSGYAPSTNATATNNNSSGSCVISYLGSPDGSTTPGVYKGNSAGMWNPDSGSISGQFWGGYNLSGTNNSTNFPQIYNTNSFPVIIPIVTNLIGSNVVINPDGTTNFVVTNTVVTNFLAVEPIGSNAFQNSVMMNGSFDGYVQNKYPNQTFSAQGSVAQQQLFPPQQGDGAQSVTYDPSTGTYTTNYNQEGALPVQMAAPLNIPVTVQGIRISDSYNSFTTVSNAIPYSFTTYTITNISGLQNVQ